MAIPMFPVLLFVTALLSLILYLRTNYEIFGVLAGGMLIACLIWVLTIAHWSFHLLALIALLFLGKPLAIATPVINVDK
ncbi:hypothetical protein [Myxosarcina sp. GI1(2024)]